MSSTLGFSVASSTSQNTGRAPCAAIALPAPTKLTVGSTTSSPGPMPSSSIAMKVASVQEFTDRLAVPGASLYYEVRGSGPALLIIPSGNGDAAPFLPLAETLSDEYTVITYDRRGFSRSPLNRPVGDDRLSDDAHDIGALLDLLADGPAAVFGSSSGAIVALATLERHPDQVRTVIAHEPPLASVLPDAEHWLGFYADLYQTYRTSGVDAARKAF